MAPPPPDHLKNDQINNTAIWMLFLVSFIKLFCYIFYFFFFKILKYFLIYFFKTFFLYDSYYMIEVPLLGGVMTNEQTPSTETVTWLEALKKTKANKW